MKPFNFRFFLRCRLPNNLENQPSKITTAAFKTSSLCRHLGALNPLPPPCTLLTTSTIMAPAPGFSYAGTDVCWKLSQTHKSPRKKGMLSSPTLPLWRMLICSAMSPTNLGSPSITTSPSPPCLSHPFSAFSLTHSLAALPSDCSHRLMPKSALEGKRGRSGAPLPSLLSLSLSLFERARASLSPRLRAWDHRRHRFGALALAPQSESKSHQK